MYLSEGGMASSTRAAQFMKALTRIVWRVIGRRTSLRLVQCIKANSGISSTWVLQRSIFSSSRQLSHARAPRVTKCIGRASAVISVELRQPGVNSLTLACSTDSRGDGSSLKATSARLIQPLLGFTIEHICNSFRCTHPLQGNIPQRLCTQSPGNPEPGRCSVVCNRGRHYRKCLLLWQAVTMRSCGQFCQASALMNLIPGSTLTCLKRGTSAKAPSETLLSSSTHWVFSN